MAPRVSSVVRYYLPLFGVGPFISDLGCVWIYLPQLENANTPQIRMTSLNLAAAVDLEI